MRSVLQALENKVPAEAVPYCYRWWEYLRFQFKLARSRKSRYGDYTYIPQTRQHIITINRDLNQYAFLVTYLHEVAHMVTLERFGREVKPHGTEWKHCFKDLAFPLMKPDVFPHDILVRLYHYMYNPGASSCSDPHLYRVLHLFDEGQGAKKSILLSDLRAGQTFRFQQREFIFIEPKRSRALCKEVKTQHLYYIPLAAPVQVVE